MTAGPQSDELATKWLPFLNTYRTMCIAPEPDVRRAFEEIRDVWRAA
jgi:hypothetical protein